MSDDILDSDAAIRALRLGQVRLRQSGTCEQRRAEHESRGNAKRS